MSPREDDTTATPPHGDTLRDGADANGPTSRHGVQLDPRGERADANVRDDAAPSTPRSQPSSGETP